MCDCGLSKNLVKPNLGLANEDIETSLGVPSILKSESFAYSLWTPPLLLFTCSFPSPPKVSKNITLSSSFNFDGTPKSLHTEMALLTLFK